MKATKTRLLSQVADFKRHRKNPFVMYQHQHASLPLERLKDVPQPVIVLLEKLLPRAFSDPGFRAAPYLDISNLA